MSYNNIQTGFLQESIQEVIHAAIAAYEEKNRC